MIPFLRTLFFFMVFWLHQILILPVLLVFVVRRKWGNARPHPDSPVHAVSRTWGRMICRLGGVRIQVEDHSGLKPGEAVLFVSNHQGDFDIPVFLGFAGHPLAFVAKKELAGIPLVAQWMAVIGCIFLDRDDRRKQVAQIRETVENLHAGLSMVIFPEGTRSHGPEMGPFAKGSVQVAVRAGVRIVPVTLKDTYTLYPKEKKLLSGGRASMLLHPAIDPAALPDEDKPRLQDLVRARIQAGLDASAASAG
jgi:1-acyl-sn-glycerol-3-phosphate acyltransferase